MSAPADLMDRVAELRRRGAVFALATVVRCRRPISARPGDRAIVLEDGSFEGWVGGACAQPTTRREALRAIGEGTPRLVRLIPGLEPSEDDGVVSYPMTCHSGGELEIYVEPFAPPPLLVALGDSPTTRALTALAPQLGFAVATDPEPGRPIELARPADSWIVIATMGDRDEQAAEAALATEAAYVAMVASRRRAATVLDYLRERGLGADRLARLKAPAGLDIGAETGPEVALSILAEIVQRRRARARLAAAPPSEVRAAAVPGPVGPGNPTPPAARDPVCGMDVEVATARWTSEHEGRTIYFCAAGCKRRFDRDPSAYAAELAAR
ncbi:MAG TPA: XdhC family protein [Chloroflexota bacterium]